MKLYKYKSITPDTLSIIATKKIWVPKPNRFNDPFDCGIPICDALTFKEKFEVLYSQSNKYQNITPAEAQKKIHSLYVTNSAINGAGENKLNESKEVFYDLINNFGILSMTANCKSILMWSHYSDAHKGICIEFDVEIKEESFSKVSYDQKFPKITLHDILCKSLENAHRLFLVKHENWRYEEEYRLIEEKGDMLYDIPGNITAIIFGMSTPLEYETLVRKVASGLKGVTFRKCYKDSNEFAVQILDI